MFAPGAPTAGSAPLMQQTSVMLASTVNSFLETPAGPVLTERSRALDLPILAVPPGLDGRRHYSKVRGYLVSVMYLTIGCAQFETYLRAS
jgi:hypothetical protein